VLPFVIGVIAFVSQLAFLPKYLQSWDAIQFALALEHFDIPMHRPHPPGYLAHIAISYVFSLLGFESDTSVMLGSCLASALATIALYYFALTIEGKQVAIFATLLFMSHPYSFYLATSGETYPVEALGAILIALTFFSAQTKPEQTLRRTLFFFVLGASGGIRQNLPLFFSPLALLVLAQSLSRKRIKEGLLLLFAGIVGLCTWLLPLVFLSKDFGSVVRSFKYQFFSMYANAYSLLFGADLRAVLMNQGRLLTYLAGAISLSGIFALFVFVTRFRPRFARELLLVIVIWIVPALLWFSLLFIAKPGHLYFWVPLFALLEARAFARLTPFFRNFLTGSAVASNILLFITPPIFYTAHVSGLSYPVIRYSDSLMEKAVQTIKEVTKEDKDSAVVVTRDGFFSFRAGMFYVPEVRTLWLRDWESTGILTRGVQVCEGRHRLEICDPGPEFFPESAWKEGATVVLPSKTRVIFFSASREGEFLKMLKKSARLEPVMHGKTKVLYALWLPQGSFELRIGPYTFKRE
jgi:hypothetical protein